MINKIDGAPRRNKQILRRALAAISLASLGVIGFLHLNPQPEANIQCAETLNQLIGNPDGYNPFTNQPKPTATPSGTIYVACDPDHTEQSISEAVPGFSGWQGSIELPTTPTK